MHSAASDNADPWNDRYKRRKIECRPVLTLAGRRLFAKNTVFRAPETQKSPVQGPFSILETSRRPKGSLA